VTIKGYKVEYTLFRIPGGSLAVPPPMPTGTGTGTLPAGTGTSDPQAVTSCRSVLTYCDGTLIDAAVVPPLTIESRKLVLPVGCGYTGDTLVTEGWDGCCTDRNPEDGIGTGTGSRTVTLVGTGTDPGVSRLRVTRKKFRLPAGTRVLDRVCIDNPHTCDCCPTQECCGDIPLPATFRVTYTIEGWPQPQGGHFFIHFDGSRSWRGGIALAGEPGSTRYACFGINLRMYCGCPTAGPESDTPPTVCPDAARAMMLDVDFAATIDPECLPTVSCTSTHRLVLPGENEIPGENTGCRWQRWITSADAACVRGEGYDPLDTQVVFVIEW
jgi:hypothetical protein